MKALRDLLLIICFVATLGWAVMAMVMIWSTGPSEMTTKLMGSFGVGTLASLVGLGATYYARHTD